MASKLPPLYAAIAAGDEARVMKLLTAKWYRRTADLNGDDTNRGCSPLHHAVLERQLVIIRRLMRHRPRPDVNRAFANHTALDAAIHWGNQEIVHLLKDAGALTFQDLQ